MPPGILIIEDEVGLARNIKAYLERNGFEAHVSRSGSEGLDEFERFKPDIVLLDFRLPDLNGLEVLTRLRGIDLYVKVIMMTGQGSTELAVSAMKAGAHDYLSKPIVLKELRLLLEKAAGHERLEGALRYYQEKDAVASGLSNLLGESPPMLVLKQKINKLVEADHMLGQGSPASVLITGETGTGKELVARAIHFDGPRRHHPFIEINCAAIPSHLLESELFGYERGAFTDARQRKQGLAEAADGGTLFLDEIGDLDQTVQAKLLRLLEDKSVRRLGGLRDHKVDVRIISATNQSLEQQVRERQFRSDLYFRFRVMEVEIPPLRERGDDILLLAEHFLAVHCKRYGNHCNRYGEGGLRFSPKAKEALRRYPWPGNVRELRNSLEQTVLLAQDPVIEPGQLIMSPQLAQTNGSGLSTNPMEQVALPDSGIDLGEWEQRLVAQALEKTSGNVTRAAKLLGMSRDTLRYRLGKYQLKPVS
jgi:DNA-binding NtrC family response regulator